MGATRHNGVALAAALFLAQGAHAQDGAGRAKLAEMTALVRLANEECDVTQPWPMEALMLVGMARPPIREDEISVKETEMKQFRFERGHDKFCELYEVEMRQAHLLTEIASRR